MKNILVHIGRVLLALYFLAPGIAKFTSWDYHVALMESPQHDYGSNIVDYCRCCPNYREH